MLTRNIPNSGEALPAIGLDTWQAFDIGGDPAARDDRRAVMQALFDAGGSVIDSSPMYGRSEAVVGGLLGDMAARDRGFVATKVWTQGGRAGIEQMEASFRKLRCRTIDLMQIHNLVDWRTHLRKLREWQDAGRIRYIGITHYTTAGLDELARVIEAEPLDFVQLAYSIGVPDAEARVLPLAAERGVAVLVNRPLEGGALVRRTKSQALPAWAEEFDCASWAQLCLKYILSHPAVTCAIPATANPAHMRDNLAAGQGALPDERQRQRLRQLWLDHT